MAKNAEKITTLLLDAAFLPHCFLTGKTTFLHLLKNSIKCFDSQSNLIENNNEWFKNEGIYFYDDQPFLTSKDKIWLLPTIAVLKRKTFFDFKTKCPNKMSLKKLAIIFNNTCQICFERYDKKDLTIEHIYPKCKGGTKEIENITLSCKFCNQKKKDIYPFLSVKKTEIKTTPIPLPILPDKTIKIREEWNKFFIYKKI